MSGIRERIHTLVALAAANRSSISLNELAALMPSGNLATAGSLERFLATDEVLSAQFSTDGEGEITFRGQEGLALERISQRERSQDRLAKAAQFLRKLSEMCPWILIGGISGSTAYRSAKKTDDIDYFLVTEQHRTWITLLFSMAMARIERVRSHDSLVFCFNRTLGRTESERVFRNNRESLFAREALNLVVIHGDDFYGKLLASAPWMASHFPVLYFEKVNESAQTQATSSLHRIDAGAILNLVAYFGLAPYLWLASLFRNYRLRRDGLDKHRFRLIVRPGCYATESVAYDEIRKAYRQAFG